MSGIFEGLDTRGWLRNIIAAFIGGGASAITSGTVVSLQDPDHYKFGGWPFLELVGGVFVVSGLMSVFMYLKQSPVPPEKKEDG